MQENLDWPHEFSLTDASGYLVDIGKKYKYINMIVFW